jgi:hypothetical protein
MIRIMNWNERGRERSWYNLRYYPGIFLEGLRKLMKNFSQYSRLKVDYLSLGLPEYATGALPTKLRGSVSGQMQKLLP